MESLFGLLFICGQILCGFLFIACPLPVIVRRICLLENFENLSLLPGFSRDFFGGGKGLLHACISSYIYIYLNALSYERKTLLLTFHGEIISLPVKIAAI